MDDLFKAMQMFQQGVKDFATTRAVNDANQQMYQINTQLKDEGEKRVALQQLGNQLALQLTGVGADAAKVAQAFNAVTPQNFGSAEQLQLEGQLSGNKFYQQQASKIIGEREQKEIRAEDRKFSRDLLLAEIAARGKKAESAKMSGEQMKRLDYTKMAFRALQDAASAYDEGVNTFSLIGDNKFTEASRRFQEGLGRLQTGAAISKDEETRFRGMLPSWTDSEEVAKLKFQKVEEELSSILRTNLGEEAAPELDRILGQGRSSGVKVKRLPNGKIIKYRDLGNDQIEVLD